MKWNLVRFGVLVPAACLLLIHLSELQADIFEVRGGGTITGKLLNDPKSPIFKIRTNDGVEIEIPSGKLKQPVPISPDIEAIYKSMAGKEDSPELHRALGLELNRLKSPLAYAHRERVVELEPTDANWSALSEHAPNKQTGEWERTEVLQKRKGLVLNQGVWDSPQSLAIIKYKNAEKVARADMAKMFNIHLKNLDSKTPKLSSAAAEFFSLLGNSEAFYQKYQLNDRLAIKVMADLLLNPKSTQVASPAFLMELLAKMPENQACSVFVEIALESPNAQLQQQALELLDRSEQSREYAFMRFWSELINPDTKDKQYIQKIDRAGNNLKGLADKRAIPVLIDRLNSMVSTTISTPGSNTFNKDGSGGGMSTGGTQKIDRLYQHQSILSALVGVADGESYSYDQPAWRLWYANKYAKTNMDLRRDE
jgi:hypothetical protein